MKYVVSWTYRRNGPAAANHATQRRRLAVFATWSQPQTTAYRQFVDRADGGGGLAVVETDNPADLAETTRQFGALVDYQIYPVVDIAEVGREPQPSVEFREAVGWR